MGPHPVSFRELLESSDIVTLHCPGGDATRNLIDQDAIAHMKPGAVLINAAEPLRPGSPLRKLDNVVLMPHAAGMVMDDIDPMARHALANITLPERRGDCGHRPNR